MRLFNIADYVVFGVSLLLCAAIGVYHAFISNKQTVTASNFLTAGHDLKVLPLTISLVVSVVSAVTLLGLPAEMYVFGSQYFWNIGSGLGIFMTAFIFVPLLHPLRLTSMFEYLELRFNSKAARLTGSVMEILALLLYGGTALFAPAIALEGVTPFPIWSLALTLGALVTFYTALGGLRTVIWTDVIQAVIMLVGIIAIVIKGVIDVGGLGKVFEYNSKNDRIHGYDFDIDPTTRHTFWGLTLGFGFGGLSFYGASQFTFQRFSATKTLKEAKLTVLLNLPAFYIFHILLCFTGLIIYAYYDKIQCDPLKNKDIKSSNQLLPLFVVDTLGSIPGIPGLFVASVTGGALSTISSVINAVASLVWDDILKRIFPQMSDVKALRVTKLLICISGAAITGLTFLANSFGPHIFQVCFAFLGATGGPQLGMFLLGAIIPWANGKGAVSGCIAGSFMTAWVTVGAYVSKPSYPKAPSASVAQCSAVRDNMTLVTDIMNSTDFYSYNLTSTVQPEAGSEIFPLYKLSYTWYTALGAVVCFLVGLVVSQITGGYTKPEEDGEGHQHQLVLPWYDNCKAKISQLSQKCPCSKKSQAKRKNENEEETHELKTQDVDPSSSV